MSAIVYFISFFTFNDSMSPSTGQLGDLWLEGTFAYGAIVIVANMTILYGSNSHSLISILVLVASVSAYFLVFWLFSFLQVSTLADQFQEMISYPTYWLNLVFFYLLCFPLDMFFNFLRREALEQETAKEKAKKVEDRKQFVKGLKVDSLPPILHRRKQFLFI
jgi:Zn-dependent M16 (insulinase) family peptidase